MPISTADFDAQLDGIVDQTVGLVADSKPTEYDTTIFLVDDDRLTIQVLIGNPPSLFCTLRRIVRLILSLGTPLDEEPVDAYELLYDFARHQASQRPCPDAVFVAGEGAGDDGAEAIILVGRTADDRANAAVLTFERAPDNSIRITDVEIVHVADGPPHEVGRNGAKEVFRGFRDAQQEPTTRARG